MDDYTQTVGTELAAFVDQHVPDLSFKAFKMRQIPQMKIVGNSFPVVSRTTVLQAASAQIDNKTTPAIPTKPTHVVVSQTPLDVFMAAARGGAVVLSPFCGFHIRIVLSSLLEISFFSIGENERYLAVLV